MRSWNVRPRKRWLALLLWPGLMVSAASDALGFDEVIAKAQTLAESRYQQSPEVPAFLRDLAFSDYQAVSFNPESSLWREGGSRFQVEYVPAGSYFSRTVQLNEVSADGVQKIAFDKSAFNFPDQDLKKRIPADLGYAGFRLTYPMAKAGDPEPFLEFAGASYFKGIGANDHFGLSARGIAIDTGLPSGEEVPDFVEFWVERPAKGSDRMRVYGLLDGPSLAGAYRFDIQPGETTKIDVTAELFFREDVDQPGLAPLTSMFYYGENTVRPRGEWRPQVHDSDGLLIHDEGSDEWLWRPLVNPSRLKLSFLQVSSLGGFGLMQRDENFSHFEDPEARYDQRPSAWVTPDKSWKGGEVVLVEIPTDTENNNNVVSFWKPKSAATKGEHRKLAYTLRFGDSDITEQNVGHAVRTFVGSGSRPGDEQAEGAYRIIVDFNGGALKELEPGAMVTGKVSEGSGKEDALEIIEHFVEYVEADGDWRLSMLVRPAADQTSVLRGQLLLDGKPVTETWTYSLPLSSVPGQEAS